LDFHFHLCAIIKIDDKMAPYDEQKLPLFHESLRSSSIRKISSSSILTESTLTKRNRRNEDNGGKPVFDYNSAIGIRKLGADPWSRSKEATHGVRTMLRKTEPERVEKKFVIGNKLLLSLILIVVLGMCCFIVPNIAFTMNAAEATDKNGGFPDLPQHIKDELRELRRKKKLEQEQRRRQEQQQHLSKEQGISVEAFRKSNGDK